MSEKERYLIIAVEESDSTVGFYDSLDGSEAGRVEVGFWPHEIEVSPDGRTVYVSNFGVKDYDEKIGRAGASVSVIDVESRCEIDRLYTFRRPYQYATRRAPHGLKLSPQGDLFVNVEQDPTMVVFDLSDTERRTPSRTFSMTPVLEESHAQGESFEPSMGYGLPTGTHNFIFDEAGTTLFVVSGPGGITAIDPETGAVKYHRDFFGTSPIPVRGLSFTPNGQHLIASLRNEVRLLEPDTLADYKLLNNGGKGFGVDQLLYSKPTVPDTDGKYEILAPAVWESQILFIDPDDGKINARVLTGIDPIHVQLSPDGKRAYVTHGRSRYISVIDIAMRELVSSIATKGGPNGIAITEYYPELERSLITFGACLPLSGANRVEGRETRLGYEFWKEKVNAAGGILVDKKPHYVEIIYRDHESPVSIADLTHEIIDDGAQFLFGTYPSPAHIDYAKVAEERKVPLVTATGAGTKLYDLGYKNLFGIMSPASLYLAGTIDVVRLQVGERGARGEGRDESSGVRTFPSLPSGDGARPTVAFLSCEDFAAFEDAKATALYAIERGFEVVGLKTPPQLPPGLRIERVEIKEKNIAFEIIVYPDRHNQFAEILTRLRDELDLDLFLATGHLGESVALVTHAKNVKFNPRAFGLSVGPVLTSFRNQLKGKASPEHLFGAAQWTPEVPLVGEDRFIKPDEFARVFFERFSMKASYLSAGAYACGIVFEEAFRKASTADRAKVRYEISALNIDTFFAHIEFNEKGLNANKPMYTIQLRKDGDDFAEVILWPLQGAVWPRPADGN